MLIYFNKRTRGAGAAVQIEAHIVDFLGSFPFHTGRIVLTPGVKRSQGDGGGRNDSCFGIDAITIEVTADGIDQLKTIITAVCGIAGGLNGKFDFGESIFIQGNAVGCV